MTRLLSEVVRMQWSKLKKQIEQLTCNSLKSRIEFISTWYHKGGSPQRGRATLILDCVEVFEANTDKHIKDPSSTIERLTYHNILLEYLSLPIEEAINSEIELIKCLAIIDRRLGKRKLEKMRSSDFEYKSNRILFRARCEAEGIRIVE